MKPAPSSSVGLGSLKFHGQAGRLCHFLLALIEGEKKINAEFHRHRDVKQITTAASIVFGVRPAQFFSLTHHRHPIDRHMNQQAFVPQIQVHLLELRFALYRINQLMKNRQPDGIAHFQPMPGSERQWLTPALHECAGRDGALLLQIERNNKARIGIYFQ